MQSRTNKTLAIIDLDTNRERGQAENVMIVNTSERSRIAREYANQFGSRDQNSAFFTKLHDPELVPLDVIEDQARGLIERIEACGALIGYLISRPHTMETATEQWLTEHRIARRSVYKNYGTGERGPDGNQTRATAL